MKVNVVSPFTKAKSFQILDFLSQSDAMLTILHGIIENQPGVKEVQAIIQTGKYVFMEIKDEMRRAINMKVWPSIVSKTVLVLATLIVQIDDSLADGVSTSTTNTEALSVKNQNLSEASTGRKYVLTSDHPVYLRSERSEYAQIYLIIPEYSALLVFEEQEKWYRIRFFDEGKQIEGWIPASNATLYVEEHDGEYDELIKQGANEIKRRTVELEEKIRRQRIDALKIKKREISDLDYKGKLEVCEELSSIDVKNKIQYQLEVDLYRDKLSQQIKEKNAKEQKKRRDKALQEWHAKIDSLPDSDYIKSVVRNRKICLGMSDKAALLSWGKPDDINRSVGSWGKHEQWVYGSNYLYFENGKLMSWQD